jgi:hypothetical protein
VTIAGSEPDEMERFPHDNRALTCHTAVPRVCAGGESSIALWKGLMSCQVRLTATVKHTNQCGMGARLMKIGFTRIASDDREGAIPVAAMPLMKATARSSMVTLIGLVGKMPALPRDMSKARDALWIFGRRDERVSFDRYTR